MQKCPKYGKNLRAVWYAWSEDGDELQEPWWPTCRSPSLLLLTKAFLSIRLPSGLRGCSWPPRRLQTDVLGGAEHALLDVMSSYSAVKEAKGLCALQRPQHKSQTKRFWLGLSFTLPLTNSGPTGHSRELLGIKTQHMLLLLNAIISINSAGSEHTF